MIIKQRTNVVVESNVEAKEYRKGDEEEQIGEQYCTLIDQLHFRVATDVRSGEHTVEVKLSQTVIEGQPVGHAEVQ